MCINCSELTTSTFAEFLKAYRAALRNVPEKQRPSNDAEVEMISVIAIRDGDSRDLYELKAAANSPTKLSEAAKILTDILLGRDRCVEIDELTSGGRALAVTKSKPAKKSGLSPAARAALAAVGLDPAKLPDGTLEALVSASLRPTRASPKPARTRSRSLATPTGSPRRG